MTRALDRRTADNLAEADRLADWYEQGFRDGMNGVTDRLVTDVLAWGVWQRGFTFGSKLNGTDS